MAWCLIKHKDNFTLPYVFMVWYLVKHRDNFTLPYVFMVWYFVKHRDFTLPYVFMVWYLVKHRDNFTFTRRVQTSCLFHLSRFYYWHMTDCLGQSTGVGSTLG
jgi:hypothetical protein